MSLSIIKYPSGGGGGATSRFGFAGEDATAGENRSFDLNGNTFSLTDGIDPFFTIDRVNKVYAFGDYNNFIEPVIDMQYSPGGQHYISRYVQSATGNEYVQDLLRIADNGTTSRWDLDVQGASNSLSITATDQVFELQLNNDAWINFSSLLNNITIGRTSGVTDYPKMVWNNTFNILQWQSGAEQGGLLDFGNQIYQFGDNGAIIAANCLTIDKANNFWNIKVGDQFIKGDPVAKQLLIGNSTNDYKVNINGNPGFTGTVSPVNSITVVGGIVTAVS